MGLLNWFTGNKKEVARGEMEMDYFEQQQQNANMLITASQQASAEDIKKQQQTANLLFKAVYSPPGSKR